MSKSILNRETQRELAKFKKQAEAIVAKIAAARDELRDLISEYEEIADVAEQSISDIEIGLDGLSCLI